MPQFTPLDGGLVALDHDNFVHVYVLGDGAAVCECSAMEPFHNAIALTGKYT